MMVGGILQPWLKPRGASADFEAETAPEMSWFADIPLVAFVKLGSFARKS